MPDTYLYVSGSGGRDGSPVSTPDAKRESPTNSHHPGEPLQRKQTDQMRVMVAGESGLGKTTFLNNIFRHLNDNRNPMEQEAVVVQAPEGEMFGQSTTLKIEERAFEYTVQAGGQKGQGFKFFLVDTPGYGDHVNVSQSFQPVVDYILAGNKTYLEETKLGNDSPDPDDRTDVCIYFIAAHRCKPIDIEYMKQLSKVVAVIPVIGKSDSMTVDEMTNFKREIMKLAADASDLEFFNFSDETWEACLAALDIEGTPIWLGQRQPPPYAVISSQVDTQDPDGGISVPDPARKYPWGTCHVMYKLHSDNTYLRCLLLGVGFQDMKDEMRKRHRVFRQEQKHREENIQEEQRKRDEESRQEQARPLIVKTTEITKRLARRASFVAHQHDGPSVMGCRVIQLMIYTLVLMTAGWWVCTPTNPGGVCESNPTETGLAGWNEVIVKAQELFAEASGNEHVDIFIGYLNEYLHDKHPDSRFRFEAAPKGEEGGGGTARQRQ